MGDIYGFNRDTVRRIGRMLREHEARISTVEGSAAMRRKEHMRTGNDFEFGKFNSAIAPTTDLTLAKGDFRPHTYSITTSTTGGATTYETTTTSSTAPREDVLMLWPVPLADTEFVTLSRHYRTGRFMVDKPATIIRRFELTASLAAGSNADAEFVTYSTTASDYEKNGTALTVYDVQGSFEGDSGARGYCALMEDRSPPLWEVIQLACPA